MIFFLKKQFISIDSLDITADYIEFSNGTTLIEPQQRSLHGLIGINNDSNLVFNDICLKNPARGTLYTSMPNVEFKNISVDDECKCEAVENLACDKHNFETTIHHGFTSNLSCDELKNKLVNATFCQVFSIHTVNCGSEMVELKHVSKKYSGPL